MAEPSSTPPPNSAEPKKTCRGCGVEKPLDEFQKRADYTGYRSSCRKCEYAARKERERTGRGRWSNTQQFENDERLFEAIETGGETLWAFGTPIERSCAETLIRAGGVVEAALEIQLEPRQLRAHLSELQRRAATRGWSPGHDMTKTTPEGFGVKGVSTYYSTDPDTGESRVRGQWVKTKKSDEDRIAALLNAMSTIADRWTGLAEPVPAPKYAEEDLLVAYCMGDPHLGMFSWEPETGHNFDLKIAEQTLYTAVDWLVERAPAAAQALVINVGDFFHADNRNNTTTAGTPVDVDGRYPKVFSAGVRLNRRFNDRALEKHRAVHDIMEIGNHDAHLSLMLAICLAQYYENEPRVTVDTSPAKFHKYRFGKNLIATTHGDMVKLADLGQIMATDWPEDWGETTSRHWITGHVHHKQVQELRGCVARTLRTLAPSDAWHKAKGYRSGREMCALVFHREFGLIDEIYVGIDEIETLLRERAGTERAAA